MKSDVSDLFREFGPKSSQHPEESPVRVFTGHLESPDPTCLLDGQGRLLAVNEAARNEGAPAPSTGGSPLHALIPFWLDISGRERLLEGAKTPEGLQNHELRIRGYGEHTERVFWISARKYPAGGNDAYLLCCREVTEKSSELELLRICYDDLAARSDRDPTTGFYNREHFRLLLEREIERSQQLGQSVTLLYLDLDDFKVLNDSHGLTAGDEYLSKLGDTLRAWRRADELIARMGGDEIGILLPNTPLAAAATVADGLLAHLATLSVSFEGRPYTLTASIGVAVFPDHAGNASELVQNADIAMNQAKRRGRARARLHDPLDRERDQLGHLRSQVERIKEAVANQRFVPVFQPVMDIASGRVVAVETLARLREDDGRLTPPAAFMDAAERFNLVTSIDRLVINGAFDKLAIAHRKSFPDLEMAINLSGLDFEDDALVADISRLARNKGIRPERVTFEITETAALKDIARVQHFTRALVAEGFRFALDDFGMGFSSFRYLRELPVSALKFDMSYIQTLPTQVENRVFVRGVTEICRGLGVKTVAEGVETAMVLSILKELGVERAQGYFVGKPDPELPSMRSGAWVRPDRQPLG